jgi:hypothetical protein
MTDDDSLPLDHEPLNRAERRAARFKPKMGLPDPHAVGGGPVADEAAGLGGDDAQSFARSGSGNVTHLTGAGTGGATESDERVTGHEGVHRGNQPNS